MGNEARLTDMVFILDKSGSMSGLEKDTIGGFNSMIRKQRTLAGDALVTTVLFDTSIKRLYDGVSIGKVTDMTEEDYEAGGSTALLDAIGSTISAISRRQKRMEGRPDHTIFVIITDGEENSSREYSHQQIRKMIQRKRKDKDWEFIFLGANIDAEETADGLGMDSEMAVNYHADSRGTQLNFEAVGTALRSLRTTGGITGRWRKDIDMDFKDGLVNKFV